MKDDADGCGSWRGGRVSGSNFNRLSERGTLKNCAVKEKGEPRSA